MRIQRGEFVCHLVGPFVNSFLFPHSSRTSNPDWITDVSTALDKKIVTMHQNPEHGPLLMTWMLMKYHVIELNEENEEFRKYRQYGTKAVQLDVFGYLQTMCTHPIYRDASVAASIACRTMYNQLTFLCDIFDSGRAVSQHKNIYELLSELLKIPAIAKDFCTADGEFISMRFIATYMTICFIRRWSSCIVDYSNRYVSHRFHPIVNDRIFTVDYFTTRQSIRKCLRLLLSNQRSMSFISP